jgi:2-polyprenyl-3-methyl-5-hydroxy-6-metoxy-1,4-benzoquinol methylase
MKETAERLGPKLIRRIPAPLRPSLARMHRPLARYLAAAKYRRKYGGQFVSMIDGEDDLLHYGFDLASAYPAFRYYNAVRMYLEGGEWNAAEVETVLGDVGFSLREAGSVLEFACGYGRLTRHFVPRIGPSKITVSDIDHRAVDFVRNQFGVRGFYSAGTGEELIHEDRYDAIVVVSLFSHLSIRDWGPWLKRLNQMLNADGVLLFSTHNVNDADKKDVQAKAEGFLYREQNETRGRLNVKHYGTAYVNEQYVEQVVSENFAGRLLKFCPHALMGGQDAYVLQRVNEFN